VDGLSHQKRFSAPEKPVLRIEVDPNSIFYDGFWATTFGIGSVMRLAVEASWDTMAQQFQELSNTSASNGRKKNDR